MSGGKVGVDQFAFGGNVPPESAKVTGGDADGGGGTVAGSGIGRAAAAGREISGGADSGRAGRLAGDHSGIARTGNGSHSRVGRGPGDIVQSGTGGNIGHGGRKGLGLTQSHY